MAQLQETVCPEEPLPEGRGPWSRRGVFLSPQPARQPIRRAEASREREYFLLHNEVHPFYFAVAD